LKKDSQGYFYFVDRIGDTFRWKSENVSTNEVSEVVSAIPGIKEANIYGVEVPAQDGRAGMASLVIDENFSISEFYQLLLDELPKYSIPVFLRISPEIETTGTFKYKKTDLVKDGFDPNTITDELYFADTSTNQYVKLDANLFQKIHNQEVRI
jgi:fatty-acyl-CoA synthase